MDSFDGEDILHCSGNTTFNTWKRLAKNPPEAHGGWKGNQLIASTITETWAGAREMFGEL